MKRWVLGLMFYGRSPTGLVMIKKQRPPRQAGLWSVPGGRIEIGESAAEAMRREFKEETGVDTRAWWEFATFEWSNNDLMYCFCQWSRGQWAEARTTTDEEVEKHDIIPTEGLAAHLDWLIPLAQRVLRADMHGSPEVRVGVTLAG